MTEKKYLTLAIEDGSIYGIPLEIIARNRAENYKDEFANDIERSLAEDTLPLFEDDPFEAVDWASNNMNWEDVQEHAVQLRGPEPIDFQSAWNMAPKAVQSFAKD